MGDQIRLLMVEDNEDDAELILAALRWDGLPVTCTRVDTAKSLQQALADERWDAVISDYRLPSFTGLEALETLRQTGHDLPFLIVSGTIDDQLAVEAMRSGAHDYIMKENLARLAPAVRRELKEAEGRLARRRAEESYRNLVDHSLQGLAIFVDSQFSFVNPTLCEILERELDELLSMDADEVVDLAYGNDRDLFIKCCLEGGPCAPTDGRRSEVRLITREGAVRWLEVHSRPISVAGRPAVQATFVDVSRRKARERELEAISTLASALRAASNSSEMVPVLLDEIMGLLQADGAALVMGSPATGMVIEGSRGVWAEIEGGPIDRESSLSAEILLSGQPYIGTSAAARTRLDRIKAAERAEHLIGVPLVAEGLSIGVLWIGCRQPTTIADHRVATAIADMAASALHRATLHEETRLRLQQLHALRSIDLAITTSSDLGMAFDVVLEQVIDQLAVHGASLLRFDSDAGTFEQVAVHGIDSLLADPDGFGELGVLLTRIMSDQRQVSVADLRQLDGCRVREDALIGAGFTAYVGVPLIANGNLCGVLEVYHRDRLDPDEEWKGFLETVAWQAAIAVERSSLEEGLRRSNRELSEAYESTLEGWARALELRDQETEGHARRVTDLTERLALGAGLEGEDLVNARRGALLHDIGKMAIPDSILLKPGPLDDREWEIMRRHPLHAVEMLSSIPHLQSALVIPYGHHERWDGSGYPLGLEGEEIPLPARIFAVIDVWDALRSDRPYRQAWSAEEVRAYLREQAGTTLDIDVVTTFLEMISSEASVPAARRE